MAAVADFVAASVGLVLAAHVLACTFTSEHGTTRSTSELHSWLAGYLFGVVGFIPKVSSLADRFAVLSHAKYKVLQIVS